MEDKSIIVIGAGIAGLSVGCYGQMNGYRTEIFELHDKPGGLCTAWTRKGYTFDGCIHWLVGSKNGTSLNEIWQELGAVQGRKFIDTESYASLHYLDGPTVHFYTNLEKWRVHLKSISPEDAGLIDEIIDDTGRLAGMDMTGEPSGILDGIKMGLKMLPLMGTLRKWSAMNTDTLAAKFKSPVLRRAFGELAPFEDAPALILLMPIAMKSKGDAAYPVGGSLAFAQAIEKRYNDLGGKIHYSARVDKILVENNRAVGIRLTDGSEHHADVIVSAADGYATVYKMLDGKYTDKTIDGYYKNMPIFPPTVQVSVGVNADLSNVPTPLSFEIERPLEFGGKKQTRIGYRHFAGDPTMAPAGKGVFTTMFIGDYEYWKNLAQDSERYDAEKKQIGISVTAELEKKIPEIRGKIEVIDVATPLTTERYTGNWKGSMEGWLVTTKSIGMMFGGGMQKTLPGLKNFYMAGQWVEPGGGVPTGAMSARRLIKKLCKQDGKSFHTSMP